MKNRSHLLLSTMFVLMLGACSSTPQQPTGNKPSSTSKDSAAVLAAKAKTEARYSIKQDVGPTKHRDMTNAADAIPKVEPKSRGGNKSRYEVWGQTYSVMPSSLGFTQQGMASWYGQKFHGHLTSNGETYDMYSMSAAHKSLPLPTYARITNLANNKMVIVRVNDRGPFHGDRVIDLSYAAASKLDYRKTGVAQVLVEAIDPSQWSPQLERQIRAQRKANPFITGANVSDAASQSITAPAKAAVIQSKPASKAPNTGASTAEIRQQRNRVPGYYVQVAAVSQIGGAIVLRNTLSKELRRGNVFVEQASDRPSLYRVLIGPIPGQGSAKAIMQSLVKFGHGQGLMIKP